MRLKCPSTSSDESPALHSRAKSMPKSKKVINSHKNDTKPALTKTRAKKKFNNVAAAIKKHRKQKRSEPVHVFVGNLDKTVSEDNVQEHFSNCGQVLSVEIRCSGGLAMTVGHPDPAYIANYPVRQYAIVSLVDESAARKALELNGSRLEVGTRSSELVVSRSPADLPEVIEKVQQRLREYRARQAFVDPGRARKSAMRALNFEPTIIVNTCRDKDPRKKLNLFGVSFPMPLF